ncbi:MAG: beta-ketoacyl synthase chain length factor [Rhodocyclaceae bacterium]|nr:beta-ketoacyl synthase chain length factor [Rhodocyclaceae bacterium]
MSVLSAWIEGISLFAPGLTGWDASVPLLAGAADLALAPTDIPKLTVLPPAERRRVGQVVRLALATGLAACEAAAADAAELATVFASSGGDGANCHAICETLASSDRLISPIRFHNSVNNAASGYWGIATGAMAPSAIVSAFDGSFAAGLLEALCQLAAPTEACERILLISYDVPYPEPLAAARPMGDACGVGLVLARQPGPLARARIDVQVGGFADETRLAGALENVRLGSPSGRALPLLVGLAGGTPAHCVLTLHEAMTLRVDLAGAS